MPTSSLTNGKAPRPARVLVCSGTYVYAVLHPHKEVPLLQELLARGFVVRRVALDTHAPHYPPHLPPEVPGVPTAIVRQHVRVLGWLLWADVVVVPSHRNSDQIIRWAQALGKTAVQHDDHGGLDSEYLGADWAAVKGPFFRAHMAHRNPQMAERIVNIGCIEYDDIHSPATRQWTREAFCREYGLDPQKRIAAWLPTANFRLDEWGIAKYKEICQVVQASPNHSLIIKGHAADYTGLTRSHNDPFGGRPSWEALAPGAPVCRAEHTTVCLLHADVGLTIHSSVGLEYPLYGRPMVYVDAFDTPRVQKRPISAARERFPIQDWATWPVPWSPGLVGLSVTTRELPEVLAANQYDRHSPEEYAAHIEWYLTAGDGQAFRRLADVIGRAAQAGPAQRLGRAAATARWLALLARHAPGLFRRHGDAPPRR